MNVWDLVLLEKSKQECYSSYYGARVLSTDQDSSLLAPDPFVRSKNLSDIAGHQV